MTDKYPFVNGLVKAQFAKMYAHKITERGLGGGQCEACRKSCRKHLWRHDLYHGEEVIAVFHLCERCDKLMYYASGKAARLRRLAAMMERAQVEWRAARREEMKAEAEGIPEPPIKGSC